MATETDTETIDSTSESPTSRVTAEIGMAKLFNHKGKKIPENTKAA